MKELQEGVDIEEAALIATAEMVFPEFGGTMMVGAEAQAGVRAETGAEVLERDQMADPIPHFLQ